MFHLIAISGSSIIAQHSDSANINISLDCETVVLEWSRPVRLTIEGSKLRFKAISIPASAMWIVGTKGTVVNLDRSTFRLSTKLHKAMSIYKNYVLTTNGRYALVYSDNDARVIQLATDTYWDLKVKQRIINGVVAEDGKHILTVQQPKRHKFLMMINKHLIRKHLPQIKERDSKVISLSPLSTIFFREFCIVRPASRCFQVDGVSYR